MVIDAGYIVGLSPTILAATTLTFAYAVTVTAVLALQNRSPQSTFAWVQSIHMLYYEWASDVI